MNQYEHGLADMIDPGEHPEHYAAAPPAGVRDTEPCPPPSVHAEAVLRDAERRDEPTLGEDLGEESAPNSDRPPALPTDSAERKRTPLCTGCLDYFWSALEAVAACSIDAASHVTSWAGEIVECLARRGDQTCAQYTFKGALYSLCLLEEELGGRVDGFVCGSVADLFDTFPRALAAVAQVSYLGNEKHNPGQPLHHARGKSTDHADCIMRHLVERGKRQEEIIPGIPGALHSASQAWRWLALAQEEREAQGAPLARGARLPEVAPAPSATPVLDAALREAFTEHRDMIVHEVPAERWGVFMTTPVRNEIVQSIMGDEDEFKTYEAAEAEARLRDTNDIASMGSLRGFSVRFARRIP